MKIINYSPEKPGSYGIARFGVEVPPGFFKNPVEFCRFRLVRSKSGFLYFKEPPYSEESENGEKKWMSYYTFSRDDKKRLEEAVLPLLESHFSNLADAPEGEGSFPEGF